MSLRNELPRSIADFDGAGRVCGDGPDPVLDRMHCLPCHQNERTEDLYGILPMADIPVELQDKVKQWRCYQSAGDIRKGKGGLPASKYDVDVRPARVLDDRHRDRERMEGREITALDRENYTDTCQCSVCVAIRGGA